MKAGIFQRLKNRRGAFLFEALLVVMILSVGLVGLIRALLSSLNAAKEAEQYSRAILAADNALLDVIRLNGQKVASTVVLEVDNKDLNAKVAMQKFNDSQSSDILREAQLKIKWLKSVKEKEVNAVTLVFGSDNEE